MTPEALYDASVEALERVDGELRLSAAGLEKIAQTLSDLPNNERIDALAGVAAAASFAATQPRSDLATASLFGIVMAVLERAGLDADAKAAWSERAAQLTGRAPSRFEPRDEPASPDAVRSGPFARFQLGDPHED